MYEFKQKQCHVVTFSMYIVHTDQLHKVYTRLTIYVKNFFTNLCIFTLCSLINYCNYRKDVINKLKQVVINKILAKVILLSETFQFFSIHFAWFSTYICTVSHHDEIMNIVKVVYLYNIGKYWIRCIRNLPLG